MTEIEESQSQNVQNCSLYSGAKEILWREDMKVVGVRKEDAEDKVRWRQLIRCGDP